MAFSRCRQLACFACRGWWGGRGCMCGRSP
jgi:hypothetical protein